MNQKRETDGKFASTNRDESPVYGLTITDGTPDEENNKFFDRALGQGVIRVKDGEATQDLTQDHVDDWVESYGADDDGCLSQEEDGSYIVWGGGEEVAVIKRKGM